MKSIRKHNANISSGKKKKKPSLHPQYCGVRLPLMTAIHTGEECGSHYLKDGITQKEHWA